MQNTPQFVKFVRVALKKGFQFTGFLADGTSMIVRKMATRPYAFAAIHSTSVNTKFWGEGTTDSEGRYRAETSDVRGYVTFHGNARPSPAHKNDIIVAVIPIEDGGSVTK